jgi:hypothetical protein
MDGGHAAPCPPTKNNSTEDCLQPYSPSPT